MPLRLDYGVNIVIPIEYKMPSLRIVALVDTMVRGALEEAIAQLNKAERLGLEEEIWQGDLRLQELMKDRVWLREKSALLEAKSKKLEDRIKKDFLDKKPKVIKQGAHDHIDEFEDYCWELISLMPWIGPRITKWINHGGVMLR